MALIRDEVLFEKGDHEVNDADALGKWPLRFSTGGSSSRTQLAGTTASPAATAAVGTQWGNGNCRGAAAPRNRGRRLAFWSDGGLLCALLQAPGRAAIPIAPLHAPASLFGPASL